MLTTPYNATAQTQRSRAQFMLTAGGRVVRIRHDPSAGNKLMVPTEHELKTILYEQTGARNTTEDYRCEHIDYVALNAQPRPRNNDSKKQARKKATRIVGSAKTITGRRARASGLSRTQHQETADDTVHHPPGLHHATASPSDEESREDEDVSLFLDSFSASGMASKYLTSASETAIGAQSSSSLLPPRGETLDVGRTPEAGAPVVEDAQATLAISEPLAQIDLYGILARAPPAEAGSAAARNPGGNGEEKGGPTISKKAEDRHRQDRGSSKKLAKIESRGERRAFKTVGPMTPREELGGYLARDPLGEEVAALDAQARESLRRARKDANRERRAPTIDIGRHYAALFVGKTRPTDATKRLVDDDGAYGNGNRDTAAAAAAAAAAVVFAANDDGHASYAAQGLSQGRRAHYHTFSNRRRGRRRRRRSDNRKEDSKAHDFQTSANAGVGPLSCGAGNRGRWSDVATHNYLDKKNHPHEALRGDENGGQQESDSGLSTRGVDVKGVAQGGPHRMVKTEQDDVNKSSRAVSDGHWAACGKRRENEIDRSQSGWVTAEGNGGTGKNGARQQQEHSPNDYLETCDSDYGEESFEPTDESAAGSLDAGINEPSSLANRGDAGDGTGDGIGRKERPACSGHGASAEETLPEESTAAALRIESCWRGFLGRCAAKNALRSSLLTALRNIGGGKISKVLTLADIEREDKRGLNRALRVATLSRQQLPPQAHIAACVRFVEALQRRRTRVVEARKRRWVAERRQRKESECCCGYGAHRGSLGLPPGFAPRANSNPASFAGLHRKSVVVVVAAAGEGPRDVGGRQ